MPRSSGSVAVAQGPNFTSIFSAAAAGGSDGNPLLGCVLTNRGSADLEIRMPLYDLPNQVRLLRPDEQLLLRGIVRPILAIEARGVGAASTIGIDEVVF